METLIQDLRYGLRSLLKKPGFTASAVLTLALGIGANTAVFSTINALFLRPYPYANPNELVVIESKSRATSRVSFLDYLDFKERNQVFASIGAVTVDRFNLGGLDEPIRVKGGRATASLFQVLSGPMTLGRAFLEGEDQPGGDKVMVLSERLWQRSFAADPDIVGTSIRLDGEPYTVVGVAPQESQFPDTDAAELFVPLAMDKAEAHRADRSLFVLARLRPDATAEQADSAMAIIGQQLAQEFPDTNAEWTAEAQSLREFRTAVASRIAGGSVNRIVLLLGGIVGFVLLLCCSNVANLLLQKSSAREREFAVRSAIGAGHWRLVRQLLTESLVLALLGGITGIALAYGLLKLIVLRIPRQLPSYLDEFKLDPSSLAFMTGISLLTAILFGLVPIYTALKAKLANALRASGDSAGQAGGKRLRGLLVTLEIALSVILLIGADLLITNFRRLQEVDPGFRSENVFIAQVELPTKDYPEPEQRLNFYEEALSRIRSVPGVEVAAIGTNPLMGTWSSSGLVVENQSEIERQTNPRVGYQLIAGDYFEATGVPLTTGRPFQTSDHADAERVCVISKKFANYFWPGEDPIGKRLKLDGIRDDRWLTIVGVAGSTKRLGLSAGTELEVYLPYRQVPFGPSNFYVRTMVAPLSLTETILGEFRQLDPDLPISEISTLEKMLDDSLWLQDVTSFLVSFFALIALAIASVGIYGAVSFSTAMRSRELGIRMAIGASKLDILRMVLGQGLKQGLIGIVLGLAGAFALSRSLSTVLFEVSSTDPLIFTEISLLLLAIALIANLIPARKASNIQPVTVLRYE